MQGETLRLHSARPGDKYKGVDSRIRGNDHGEIDESSHGASRDEIIGGSAWVAAALTS